jgi:hypothetical protein
MRDGSTEDMTGFWIARVLENSDWTTSSETCLALIRHAAQKYLKRNTCPHFGPQAVAKLDALLSEIHSSLPKSPTEQSQPDITESWMVPTSVNWSKINPDLFKQRYAYYWTTNMWRSDFLATLESQFWVYRDYAHGAGKGKMAFLRELAEVWIVAAATALVLYADNDKRVWLNTAKLLRRVADMVEADGLRALPWGHWGHMQAPSRIVPKADEA